MNNTKWLRRALLGGAALSVMATGAQADELSALKAQLEVLQSRVSQLESQPAEASLPPGTKLLTVRKGAGSYAPRYENVRDKVQDHQGYTIAVTPTADMPAPVSEVTVSGDIRLNIAYNSYDIDGDSSAYIDIGLGEDQAENDEEDTSEHVGSDSADFDLTARGRLRVDGRTETAIGEVGGSLRIRGDNQGPGTTDAFFDLAWGYWQMTPNLQLSGGYDDSLATIPAGTDASANFDPIAIDADPDTSGYAQMRLTYNSGGFTAAIGVEHNPNDEDFNPEMEDDENKGAVFPGVAGRITFDTGSLLLAAVGKWEQDKREYYSNDIVDPLTLPDAEDEFEDTEDNWLIGAGAILKISDFFRIEAAANMGEGMEEYFSWSAQCSTDGDCENDMEHWAASVLGVFGFAEGWALEVGGAYTDLTHEEDEDLDDDIWVDNIWSVGAALVWNPVDQLTLIWGAAFNKFENGASEENEDDDNAKADHLSVGMSSIWRF